MVLPDGPDRCTVHFEYWLDESLVGDDSLISASLAGSDQVGYAPNFEHLLALTSCGHVANLEIHPMRAVMEGLTCSRVSHAAAV